MKRFVCICLGVVLIAPAGVFAAGKEKKPKAFIKVDSVNVTENTISITDTGGNEKTYTVDARTVILVNDKPGKLADIQRGMKADVTASATKASRIEVKDPPEEKPEKKKKK